MKKSGDEDNKLCSMLLNCVYIRISRNNVQKSKYVKKKTKLFKKKIEREEKIFSRFTCEICAQL